MPAWKNPDTARARSLMGALAVASLLGACTVTPAALPASEPPAVVKRGEGRLISDNGARIVPNGGANIVPNGGANAVSNGGATIVPAGPHAGLAAQLQDLAAIGHTRAVAGILANNGSQVVSNNTGSLLAKGGGTLRLAQLAPPAFSLTPSGTELAAEELPNPDGTTTVYFDRPDGTQRFVVLNAERRPLEQGFVTQVVSFPDGTVRSSHTERTLVYGNDQQPRGFLAYDVRYDEAGRLLALTHAPSSIAGAGGALKIVVQELAFTVEPPSGRFEVRFENLKAVEKGSITAVERNVGGQAVGIDLADPLATLGGESRFETADGRRLFDRRTTLAGDEHALVLTLRDGYALALKRAARSAPYTGDLLREGVRIGAATLTTRADASVAYAITFEDGTPPLVVTLPEAAAATP